MKPWISFSAKDHIIISSHRLSSGAIHYSMKQSFKNKVTADIFIKYEALNHQEPFIIQWVFKHEWIPLFCCHLSTHTYIERGMCMYVYIYIWRAREWILNRLQWVMLLAVLRAHFQWENHNWPKVTSSDFSQEMCSLLGRAKTGTHNIPCKILFLPCIFTKFTSKWQRISTMMP